MLGFISSFCFVISTFPIEIAQLNHKFNCDEYEKVKLRRNWVDYLQRRKTMTSLIIKVKASEVNQWMATSIYSDDDVLAIIRGVSPHSRPTIDHHHQLELQSAQ
jgi:hypothetical protein